jgi:hypothetical protein
LRGDVFALGRILESLSEPNAPRPLRSIQKRAAANDPMERYADASLLGRDIAAYLDGLVVEAHHENPFEWAGRLLRRHRAWVGLVAAYAIARIILIFWQSR